MSEMDGWQIKRLDQIGDVYSGATPSTAKAEYWDGDIVWVTPNDLSKLQTPFLSESAKKITKRGLKNSSTHLLPARSVTISSRAPIGYVAVPVVDFCTNQGCKSIKLYPEYHSEYVYYNILFNVEKLKNLGEGTTFAEISKTTFSAVEMPFLDNFEEQKQIATILSALDLAIEQTEAIIAKQQRIKVGLMQDLLTKGIGEHGVIRSEATHEFKDSPLGRIPVEWDVVNVGTAAYVTKLAGFEFTNYFNYAEGGEVIALRALNIKNEGLHLTDIQTISKKVSDRLPRSKINSGDILITYIGAYIGDVLRIHESDKYHLAPNIAKIVCYSRVLPEFLEVAMRSQYMQRQIQNLTATTATPSLTMTQIRSLLLAIPKDKNEQLFVYKQISTVSKMIFELSANLEKFRRQKTGLMHDLLTGTVRV